MGKEKKYFKVDRADNCIWLTEDKEGKPISMHFTPDQAKKVSKLLQEIAG